MPHATLLALAAAVRSHLDRTGVTQEDFAAALGWTQSNLANKLARMETGGAVSWETAERLATAVGFELKLVPAEKKARKR